MSQSPQTSPTGHVLTPSGWVRGHVVASEGRIERIEGTPVRRPDDPGLPYILPGFVDLHVHGGDGADYAGGEEGIRRFIRFHARSGTVAMAPTTSTSPVEVIERALADIERVRLSPEAEEPTILGAHLEGPFINPGKLGAQRDMTLAGDPALALRWAGLCRLVVATVAPEIPGGIAVIEALAGRGCRVQAGHSLATAEETALGFARGLSGFTHLFNGMSGLDHRKPGVAAYALAEGRYAELICDLTHVHPALLLAAYRAIPRLYAITDATTAAGCPDGTYRFGDHAIVKAGLVIRLAGRETLAGSAITMLDAFRNLVSLGLSIVQASDLCATRQADYLGLDHLGRLVPGALASFVVLDAGLQLESVWLKGRRGP
ncbi:N-acetylglucosamine-6-phosphate deacetylase [Labrys monachus]|uniref:N-acetylglucosamine-6-phosphate deacetylase n=1 Tax=Labrys monachus TaxID=217067 RepID=A0ABU0FJM8_9HYPH|nr:amidohydrolase family protein [Labrys monachus]MDQ0394810.1 N-acetylglucosamine-6-phosphate deacetylase [Labrys monachus]